MEKRRVHVWISGRVQGVFFRAYTRDAGRSIGVTGWVRNLPDGRVEAVFEGDEEKLKKMIAWCHRGSPLSRVELVDTRDETCTGEFETFTIAY
ncbi:MAG: acylphosphatase [Deltaproteobacteria bacterium]|jgi:acylphosphatase|nr:acylphosphatase [Deltaproteobacteria bacterium]MDA8305311.1 acylphosphatase [Deltaproteobacteria bacterium]